MGVALGFAGSRAAAAPGGEEPGLPAGEPPPLTSSVPGWDEEDRPTSRAVTEEALSLDARPKTRTAVRSWLGAQSFFAEDKIMPGLVWRVGYRVVWLDMEGSFLWLARDATGLGTSFLGNHLGAHLMFAPLRVGGVLFRAGFGGDFYPLWNVHADEWQRALTARASAHVPLGKRLNLFGTARAYLLESSGLDLGVDRTNTSGLPVMFSLGLEWRT